MKRAFGLAAVGAVMLAGVASADVIVLDSGDLGGAAIPDDGYDGTFGSMLGSTINNGVAGTITDVNLTVDMEHTWVGDLTIKLMGPDGTVVTVLSRPGYAEAADDGSGCCGDSSDMFAGVPVTYDDEAASGISAEDMTDPVGGDYIPAAGAAGGPGLSGFDGLDMGGDWTLYIGDGAGGDEGFLHNFQITIEYDAVPAPGALALIGLAGCIRRRRRA